MNPDAQNSMADGAPAGPTSGAALLATFYVAQQKKDATDGLQNLLCRKLNLTQDRPDDRTDRWRTRDSQEAFLLRFDPGATHDTTVLQVALNTPGDAAGDWDNLRRKLESILEPEALEGIWGYTLIYQAKLNPGICADEAFERLRSTVQRLYPDRRASYKPLAQAQVEEGGVWLMTVPIEDEGPAEGEGPAAATVYVALSEPERERALNKLFLGEDARLQMPELIAHKSYYQRRQYKSRKLKEYRGCLDEFRKVVTKLLNKVGQRNAQSEELGELTRRYHKLVEMVWQLQDLRVSMARQLHNYDEWEIIEGNDILQYHRRYIETSNVELNLLVSEGQYALEVADSVLSSNSKSASQAPAASNKDQPDIASFLERQQGPIARLARKFQTHYDRPDETKIRNWLTLFGTPRRMELALTLLENIDYIDDGKLTDLFEAFYEGLVEEEQRMAVFTMLGGLQDSSSHLLYLCSKTLEEKERTPPRFREMREIMRARQPEHTILVFVDDNVTSGVQGTQIFREWFGVSDTCESVEPLEEAEKAWLRKARLLYFTVIGFREGIVNLKASLRELGLDIEIRSGIETSSVAGCFQATSLLFNNRRDREEAKQMAFEIGHELLADKNWPEERRREFSLGYGNSQKLLVFSYNTPTGTLPIFWKHGMYKDRKWTPLFPRRA